MNQRLETFCDGVFAIAITLLILDLKVPPLASVHSVAELWRYLGHLWPAFFALSFSFVIILISWIGHHNLLKHIDRTSSPFLLANGFFLFTVIIIPFPTAFMSEYLNTPYAQPAIVVYCFTSLLHNIAWNLLYVSILKPKPILKDSFEVNRMIKFSKGAKYGFIIYACLALLAWWLPYVALLISVSIWLYWLTVSLSVRIEN